MSDAPEATPSGFRVLVVCTANRCRSPVAAALLRRRSAEAGLHLAVSSAGFLDAGHRASDGSVRVARKAGLDLSNHRSRRLDRDLVASSDLILTMEAAHRRELLEYSPDRLHVTFTLAELAALAPTVPAADTAGATPGGTADAAARMRAWVAGAHAARHPSEPLGTFRSDDVDDPVGRSDRRYRHMAATVARHVDTLVDYWRTVSRSMPNPTPAPAPDPTPTPPSSPR